MVYNILDLKLLDEIFQERDALNVCCNLKCQRKVIILEKSVHNNPSKLPKFRMRAYWNYNVDIFFKISISHIFQLHKLL